MNSPEWPQDPAMQEMWLGFNEMIREWEELKEQLPNLQAKPPAEVWMRQDSAEALMNGILAGEITLERANELIAGWEGDMERRAEDLREAGEVGPLMARRAEREAEMKAPGAFLGPQLARNAFMAASSGVGEEEWIDRVMERFPHSPRQPGSVREAYKRTIALLRLEGPWPWPRG